MTTTDLRSTLARLGLTQTGAARLLGVDARTVRRWIAGDRDMPEPAIRLLGALEACAEGQTVREYLDSLPGLR